LIETVEYHFDAAHRLAHYNGACKNVHGHRWNIKIILKGRPLANTGMMIDFKKIKEIIDLFDHTIILSDSPENIELVEMLDRMKMSIRILEKREPTAENLAIEIFKLLNETLGDNIQKISVELWESPGCSVIYGDKID